MRRRRFSAFRSPTAHSSRPPRSRPTLTDTEPAGHFRRAGHRLVRSGRREREAGRDRRGRGDGAVGLLGVLSAKQMGAERIIAMSRHESRQKLAREFGATDIVTERGDEGVERIKQLTNGVGADSVLECVGTQESMMQAIKATRPGGSRGLRRRAAWGVA